MPRAKKLPAKIVELQGNMTAKQVKMAQLLATEHGMKQVDAYKMAYDVGTDDPKLLAPNASKAAHHAKVVQLVAELREQHNSINLHDREKMREYVAHKLLDAIENEDFEAKDHLTALRLLGNSVYVRVFDADTAQAEAQITGDIALLIRARLLQLLPQSVDSIALESPKLGESQAIDIECEPGDSESDGK